jgi:hypothetical protein
MAQNSDYAEGLFISKRNGQYGEFLSIGILKGKFIDYLMEMEEDEKGFVNFTGNPQKADQNKYSVKPFVASPKTSKATSGKTSKPQQAKKVVADDDLPF